MECSKNALRRDSRGLFRASVQISLSPKNKASGLSYALLQREF